MTNFTTKLPKNKTGFDFIFIRFAYYYIFLFLHHFRTGYVSVIFLVFQHRYRQYFQAPICSLLTDTAAAELSDSCPSKALPIFIPESEMLFLERSFCFAYRRSVYLFIDL